MASMRSGEEALKLSPFFKTANMRSKQTMGKRLFSYKFALVVHDLIIALFAFGLGGLIVNSGCYTGWNFKQIAILCIISPVVIIFFQSYNLYSYHYIFLKKKHLTSLAKSFCWSLITIGIITSIYTWPQLVATYYFITIIFLVAIGMTLFSRFLSSQMINIIKSIGISFLIVGLIGLISPKENPVDLINIQMIAFCLLLSVAFLMLNRYFLVHIVFSIWMRRKFRRQVAIIGSDEKAKRITTHIIDFNAPYWVAGVVGKSGLDIAIPKESLGALNILPDIVEQNRIDEIIVTDEKMNKRTLISLLDYCTTEGLTVWFPPGLMPIIDMKLNIDNFCDLQMIRLCSQKNSWMSYKIKHAFDALITLPVFILLLPFFLAIAFAIKLNSKGPVFYRAKAIGKNGRIFTMYKFRSMRMNSSSDIHKSFVTKLIKGEITDKGGKDRPLKITDDSRITFIGKLLRKSSLDELPQLINVLKGDMSLVGPRPCLPYEYEIYKDWHKKRAAVRPGITGLWQVAGRSEVVFEDMILLDIYYVYNRNFLMDFNVLIETIFAVLGKRGAY